jgi:hypothetical protein
MHELSIAMSIVEMAEEEAERRGAHVAAVYLKLGALSGVVKEALLSSYEMACEDTPPQGLPLSPGGSSNRSLLRPMSGPPRAHIGAMALLSGIRNTLFRSRAGQGTRSRCTGDPVMIPEPRLVEVRKNVLKANDVVARALRQRFRSAGVLVVTLGSSPGTVWTPFSNSSLPA